MARDAAVLHLGRVGVMDSDAVLAGVGGAKRKSSRRASTRPSPRGRTASGQVSTMVTPSFRSPTCTRQAGRGRGVISLVLAIHGWSDTQVSNGYGVSAEWGTTGLAGGCADGPHTQPTASGLLDHGQPPFKTTALHSSPLLINFSRKNASTHGPPVTSVKPRPYLTQPLLHRKSLKLASQTVSVSAYRRARNKLGRAFLLFFPSHQQGVLVLFPRPPPLRARVRQQPLHHVRRQGVHVQTAALRPRHCRSRR